MYNTKRGPRRVQRLRRWVGSGTDGATCGWRRFLFWRIRWGGGTASERGAKSEVAHKWAKWLPHPCRIGDPHRFRAGGKIRSGPQVGKVATSPRSFGSEILLLRRTAILLLAFGGGGHGARHYHHITIIIQAAQLNVPAGVPSFAQNRKLPKLTNEQQQMIKEVFELFDIDGSGMPQSHMGQALQIRG